MNAELQRQVAAHRARRAKFFPPACRAMPAMVARSRVEIPPPADIERDAHVIAYRCDRCLRAKSPVLRAVSFHTGVHVRDIKGPARFPFCSYARQVAMYVLVTDIGMSRAAVGRYLNRHHTTVIHALSSVAERMSDDAELSGLIRRVRETLGLPHKEERA